MKNIITAIALSVATATTASANICNVNPNAIIDYPGYHGIQKTWYDKGEYLFMFSAVSHHADPISYKTWNNVESIVTHYRLYKEDCRSTEIEVVITENKERFEAPVVEEIVEEFVEVTYETKIVTVGQYKWMLKIKGQKNLVYKEQSFTKTTVTGSDGTVKVTTTPYVHSSVSFKKNGTTQVWTQNGDSTHNGHTDGEPHDIKVSEYSNYLTNGWVSF